MFRVGAGLEEVGGEAVADVMDGDVLAEARGLGGLDADPMHRADGDGAPRDLSGGEPFGRPGDLEITRKNRAPRS